MNDTDPDHQSRNQERRELLVALAASQEVPRAVACRLAGRLDAWAARGWRTGRADAAALGVPAGALAAAAELRRRASEIVRVEGERTRALGGRVVTRVDPEYPPALRELDLPPPALWIRGRRIRGASRSVAVVGSRRTDPYGREAAGLFGRELAAAGLSVVSGFARGVDAAAHRGALSAPADGRGGSAGGTGGSTVAVLGSGLGVDYPRGHRRLGEEIAAAGALVSEFPCGVEPEPWHFPVRNRLIAALAAAVLVVRATPRSGSLITARLALDLGRDVLAVPGGIFDRRSHGTNRLIADGAHPALEPRDVLELLGVPAVPDPPEAEGEGGRIDGGGRPCSLRARVLEALVPAEPTPPEALAQALAEPVDRLLGTLLELELEGRVHREPGPSFVRRP